MKNKCKIENCRGCEYEEVKENTIIEDVAIFVMLSIIVILLIIILI